MLGNVQTVDFSICLDNGFHRGSGRGSASYSLTLILLISARNPGFSFLIADCKICVGKIYVDSMRK